MITTQQVADSAREWMNVPWVHHGRVRSGLDCLGLLIKVCEGLGIDVPDKLDYRLYGRRGPTGDRPPLYRGAVLLEECDRVLEPAREPEPGGVGVFWLDPKKRFAQHIGVFGVHPFCSPCRQAPP